MKFVCRICGYIYDEEKESTPFDSLPASWKCPVCGAGKGDFAQEGIQGSYTPVFPDAGEEHGLECLSPGQLSALCSSLARGCEKQYMPGEMQLFMELADHFAASVPHMEDARTELLAAQLKDDAEGYGALRAAADAVGDRGAARICVWGERVTRMLFSLADRYLREGEAMLEGTQIWVCTVCGFVYIGNTPPPQCPVCRVPARKFEKIEGRA